MEACQSSYLNPQPVPPRTIAATRIAPATEPIMILVPLGPVGVKESASEGKKNKKKKKNMLMLHFMFLCIFLYFICFGGKMRRHQLLLFCYFFFR